MIYVWDFKLRPQLTDHNMEIIPLLSRSAWVLLSSAIDRRETTAYRPCPWTVWREKVAQCSTTTRRNWQSEILPTALFSHTHYRRFGVFFVCFSSYDSWAPLWFVQPSTTPSLSNRRASDTPVFLKVPPTSISVLVMVWGMAYTGLGGWLIRI